VKYVEFPLTNFPCRSKPESGEDYEHHERIEAIYQQRGTNYYRRPKSPEEAKEKFVKNAERTDDTGGS